MSSRVKTVFSDYDNLIHAVAKCWEAGETPPRMRTYYPSEMMDGSIPVARISHRDNKILSYERYIMAYYDHAAKIAVTPLNEVKYGSVTTQRHQWLVINGLKRAGISVSEGISDPWKCNAESIYELIGEDWGVLHDALSRSSHFPVIYDWTHARELLAAVDNFCGIKKLSKLLSPLDENIKKMVVRSPVNLKFDLSRAAGIKKLKTGTLQSLRAQLKIKQCKPELGSSPELILRHQLEFLVNESIQKNTY